MVGSIVEGVVPLIGLASVSAFVVFSSTTHVEVWLNSRFLRAVRRPASRLSSWRVRVWALIDRSIDDVLRCWPCNHGGLEPSTWATDADTGRPADDTCAVQTLPVANGFSELSEQTRTQNNEHFPGVSLLCYGSRASFDKEASIKMLLLVTIILITRIAVSRLAK